MAKVSSQQPTTVTNSNQCFNMCDRPISTNKNRPYLLQMSNYSLRFTLTPSDGSGQSHSLNGCKMCVHSQTSGGTCPSGQRRIQGGGHGAMPQSSEIFSKVLFLMSFQIFLDSIIDLSNETITFIMPCILCSFIRSLNSQ